MDPLERRRLHWQCRRGLLELDLLLGGFLERAYAGAEPRLQAAFARLLTQPDTLLQDYFFGETVPIDEDLADVVRAIRACAGP